MLEEKCGRQSDTQEKVQSKEKGHSEIHSDSDINGRGIGRCKGTKGRGNWCSSIFSPCFEAGSTTPASYIEMKVGHSEFAR